MAWPLMQARNYRPGRARPVRLIVVHDMEILDSASTAENLGRFWQRQNAPMASAHFGVDRDSIVQYVKVGDTAFAAPNANADGIHIELPGRSTATPAQWLAARPALRRGAKVGAEMVNLLRFLGVPLELRRLTVAEIRERRAAGFCGHLDVTRAFSNPTGHVDPGTGFPWDLFLEMVREQLPTVGVDYV